MANSEDLGLELPSVTLWLTAGTDFLSSFYLCDTTMAGSEIVIGNPVNFSPGRMFIQFPVDGLSSGVAGYNPVPSGYSLWEYVIGGTGAQLIVPGDLVSEMPTGTDWSLVWLPEPGTNGFAIRQGVVAFNTGS